jgi:pimeloyl-ACP methyl ester carboxylesterase
MPTFFPAHDTTMLAYHLFGVGSPLVCLPGGPMQASAYLGDLGGLSAHRQLVLLDLRGTGESAMPMDAASYRCDRLVNDVEALREHLGLERMDLLAHSAGANLAALYAGRHPDRVGKLALVTPSVMAVGIEISGDDRLAVAQQRSDEPWFAEAFAALEEIVAGRATDESWPAISPFFYGRWDEPAQAHQAAEDRQRNDDAAAVFRAEGAYDPERTRADLARLESPVLVLAGELDMGNPVPAMAEYAGLFPQAELVVLPGAGHIPWLDDADRFVEATAAFLR